MAPYQSKNFVFTLNNPALVDGKPTPADDPQEWAGVTFGAYQHEVGENGTYHFQGYVIVAKKCTITAMKKLHPRVHWEVREGTHEQALAYVTKDDTRVENTVSVTWGDPPAGRGARSDLAVVKAALDAGATEAEIADDHFAQWVRFRRSFTAYRQLKAQTRSGEVDPLIYIFWGPPGTGKTRAASELAGPDAYWLAQPNSSTGSLWWDLYEGNDTIVIDEFYGWIPHSVMLRLCDRYPLIQQSKGGTLKIQATRIIITSNKHPVDWWPRTGLGAFERRMTFPMGRVLHLTAMPEDWDGFMADLAGPHPYPQPAGPHLPAENLNGFEAFVPN